MIQKLKQLTFQLGDVGFDVFTFDITDGQGEVGQEVCLDIDSHKAPDILGMQFTIDYDPSFVSFSRITGINSKLRIDTEFLNDNFGLPNGNPPTLAGKITFRWDAPGVNPISLDEDGETLFQVCFTVLNDDKTTVDFGNSPTVIEIVDANEQMIDFNGDPGEINGAEAPTIVNPANITDVACFGESSGVIDITVQGGTGNYMYLWSYQNANTQDISNVPAGTYNVTVTDANSGLFSIATFTVNQPASAVTINNISTIDISCFGETDGAITVAASGGTGNLSYSWNNGLSANANQINLAANSNYRVTVADEAGCQVVSEAIQISEPVEISLTSSAVEDISCFGENDGRIELTVSGGTPGFSYDWSGDLTDGVATQTNLGPGNYRVTITDSRNCQVVSDQFTINQPPQILISSISSTTIDRGNDGSVAVSANGGTGTLSYQWSGPSGFSASSRTATGLDTPGEYCVTISDANNCEITECVDLTLRLQVGTPAITAACAGQATGSIVLNAMGGSPDYSYRWSTGATGATLSDVATGNYSVTVADASGEEVVANYEVPELAQIELIAQITDVSGSANNTNGSINLTINGGQSPYVVSWNNGSSSNTLLNLAVGEYCVTVTDQQGCESSICVRVEFLSEPLGASAQVNDAKCNGQADGQITVNIVGGVPPYRIGFSDGQSLDNIQGNTATRNDLLAGGYTYTVTDSRGSSQTFNATIAEPTAITLANVDVLHDTDAQNCDGSINIELAGGTMPYTVNWNAAGSGMQIINLCEIDGGYTPTVTDANGCTVTFDPIVVNTFGITSDIQNVTCPGDEDGSVTITTAGGDEPYTYNWIDELGNEVGNSASLNNVSFWSIYP